MYSLVIFFNDDSVLQPSPDDGINVVIVPEVEDMVNIVVKIYLNKDWLSVSNGGGGCDGVGDVEHD